MSKPIIKNENKKIIAYARVSTHKQKNDLGSDLNFNKKGLNNLIHSITSCSISKLILTYKDRLLRFGSEIIFKLCDIFNIEVIIINDKQEKSSEQELSEDLCEIFTVFSARLHGRRSHKNIVKKHI